ncbi:MAG: hypothetical protein J5871_04765 [Bacteroidales bacterium]|nr:hypothetical protein [Bacteroidales bacterium]
MESSLSQDEMQKDECPAVEIFADYRLVTYDRLISEETDAGFIDAEVKEAMRKSRLYKAHQIGVTKVGMNTTDTLYYSEQIPFCADISELTRIFPNGTSSYRSQTQLDPNVNPLLSLRDSAMSLKHCVARVEIEGGKAVTYNNEGTVLSEQDVPMPDFTQYLSFLNESRKKASMETKSGIRRDIQWLRNKMASRYSVKSSGDASYAIYEREDGNIVLEQSTVRTKSGGVITIRTVLSADISKNYGYEQLENGVLKVRCMNVFSSGKKASKGIYSISVGISTENPSRTMMEALSYLPDGTPVMRVSDKEYNVNEMRCYF